MLVQAWISSLLVPSWDACHSLQGCLAGVRAPVYLQVVLPFEGLATGLTGEFPDTWGKHRLRAPPLGRGLWSISAALERPGRAQMNHPPAPPPNSPGLNVKSNNQRD